ncbi:hypothetical protein H0H92_013129 [Tricholoma furcatifolium]|nr:hypothetical protein H0H92_013129 [Tricholoma furcatifolium]
MPATVSSALLESFTLRDAQVVTKSDAVLEKFTKAVESFDVGNGEHGYLLKLPSEDPTKVIYKLAIGALEAHIQVNPSTLAMTGKNVLNVPFVSPVVLAEGIIDLKTGCTWNLGYPGLISGVETLKLQGNGILFAYNLLIYGRSYEGKKIITL